MGNCSALDKKAAIYDLYKKYPFFHLFPLDEREKIQIKDKKNEFNDRVEKNQNKIDKQFKNALENNESDLDESYRKFITYKNQLKESNSKLYHLFFEETKNKKYQKKRFNVDILKKEETDSFYFFFNRGYFESVKIENTVTIFPLFTLEYFPFKKNNSQDSPLKECSITSSIISMAEFDQRYQHCKYLEVLDLSFNSIPFLPNGFGNFTKLKKLNLRRNRLQELPKTFEKLTEITDLNLAENLFTDVPNQIFSNNKNIKFLDFSGNLLNIFSPKDVIEDCELTNLFLAHNKISVFPNFKRFTKLEYVNLDENLITSIPEQNLKEELQRKIIFSVNKNKGVNKNYETEERKDLIDAENGNKKNEKIKFFEDYYENSKGQFFVDIPKNKTEEDINNKIIQMVESKTNHKSIDEEKKGYLTLFDELEKKEKEKNNNKENNNAEKNNGNLIRRKSFVQSDKKKYELENYENLKQWRFNLLVEIVRNYISEGKEDDINEIEDKQLRKDMKKAYYTYLKEKEIMAEIPLEEKDMDNMEKNYLDEFRAKFYGEGKRGSEKNKNDNISNKNINEEKKNNDGGGFQRFKSQVIGLKNNEENLKKDIIISRSSINQLRQKKTVSFPEQNKPKDNVSPSDPNTKGGKDGDKKNPNKNEETKKKNESKKRKFEDMTNVNFLREINKKLSRTKINLFLQYVGNIDLEIKNSIKDIWLNNENNSFILLLTELKLFNDEVVNYYKGKIGDSIKKENSNSKGNNNKNNNNHNINYKITTNESKNVVHEIFFNNSTVKILYQLGLRERNRIKSQGIEQTEFVFELDENIHFKQKCFSNFLERFINILRKEYTEPLVSEL